METWIPFPESNSGLQEAFSWKFCVLLLKIIGIQCTSRSPKHVRVNPQLKNCVRMSGCFNKSHNVTINGVLDHRNLYNRVWMFSLRSRVNFITPTVKWSTKGCPRTSKNVKPMLYQGHDLKLEIFCCYKSKFGKSTCKQSLLKFSCLSSMMWFFRDFLLLMNGQPRGQMLLWVWGQTSIPVFSSHLCYCVTTATSWHVHG